MNVRRVPMPLVPRKGHAAGSSLDRGMIGVAYARPRMRLAAEIAAARAVAGLSRLVGAGAGMTVPGKLLSKLDPGAIDKLAARLPSGSAVVSAPGSEERRVGKG